MLGLQQRELEHLQALLLAAGEAVVEVAGGELARDLRELHRGLDGLAELLQRDLGLAARLAVRVHDHPQVLRDGHAGDRDRVLEGHEEAGAGALVGVGLGDVLAEEGDLALGDLERGVAHDRRSRACDLPEPLGPMSAWISPLFTVRSRPLRISFSPARTCRFLISRSAMSSVSSCGGGSAVSGRGVDRERGADGRGLGGRAGRRSPRAPARVVRCSALGDAALDARPEEAWSRSPGARRSTCEQSTRPSSLSSTKQDIGATAPSSASTASSIVMSAAGRARR